MATTALFTDTDGNVTLSTSENYFLAPDVTHYRTTTGAVLTVNDDSGNDIAVHGTIVQLASFEAIDINATGTSGVSITVGLTGSIIGSSSFRGIISEADRTVVANNGLITGGESILLRGADSAVYNTGVIQNTFTTNTFSAFAVQFREAGATLYNSGDIQGLRGIHMSFGGDLTNLGNITSTSTAIDVASNTTATNILNTGTITSSTGLAIVGGAADQTVENSGTIFGDVGLGGGTDSIANSGSITGDISVTSGLFTLANSSTGNIIGDIDGGSSNDTILNSGTITGDIDLGGGSDSVTNSGSITGDVDLSTGTNTLTNAATGLIIGDVTGGGEVDTILNTGTIAGDVFLFADDDIFTINGAGVVTGRVDGGTGDDTLTGGDSSDYLDGGDDNDRLFGRGGDDDLRGGLGSDFISAGTGDDFALGDNGGDKMFGGSGEDTLQGGRDRDTIRGGDGDDEINGGRSADILRGGVGADTFLYQFRQDSTLNLSDTIQDFEVGVDVIDVSATAAQLSFVGSAAFSGSGNEVRYEIGGNGKTFVEVDTDGNGNADMRILLGTIGALTEDDFVL